MGEVDRGHLELLAVDVLPDVELGPVGEREHAHVLALADPAVVEVPQLGALVLGVPLAELVAEGEDPLLGAGPLLVAAGAAEGGVEAVLVDRVEQRRRLQAVARRRGPVSSTTRPVSIESCTLATISRSPSSRDAAVAELDHLGEVVAGVDVHHRERERPRAERLLGQSQQHDRVLAAAEQQHRPLELGGHLAHDVDRLGLERAQVGQLGRRARCQFTSCSPHSVFSVARPATLAAAAGLGAGAHPIEE